LLHKWIVNRSYLIVGLLFFLLSLLAFLSLFFLSSKAIAADNEPSLYFGKPLTMAWETWYPYEYLENESLQDSLTGLDIQLVEILGKEVHHKIQFKAISWDETLKALEKGEVDFASGATYSKDRAESVYYSKPYRIEEDSLFILRSKANHYQFKDVTEFIQFVKANDFRLGIKEGVLYASPILNEFLSNPDNAKYIAAKVDDAENLNKLIANEIDGFIADRLVGAALVRQHERGKLVTEEFFNMTTNISLIFSKKTVPYEIVFAFNNAIDQLRQSNHSQYEEIIAWYLYPNILLQTVDTDWFQIIDILGTLFFSISGVLIAKSLNASLLAAFVYALIPSIGGGLLRDVIFNQRPVSILGSPLYIYIICLTVIIGFLISKLFDKFEGSHLRKKRPGFYKKLYKHLKLLLIVCDAFGLAAFTVTGVMISIMAKASPLLLWGPFFSFITGALGTIIRDIISKKKKLADLEGEIYSEVAIVWGLFLSLGLLYNATDINPGFIQNLVLVTIAGAFATRMFVYFFKVKNVYFN
jgi:polar amino acid transport system substrate-binding protein